MTKFTKGGWEIRQSNESIGEFREILIFKKDSFIQIARIDNISMDTDEEFEANAQLISATPDLYEACKKIQEAFLEQVFVNGEDDDMKVSIIESDLRKALAKAEGR